MASSRVDNGAVIYDGTRWREVPGISLMTQNGHAHEIPVYGEIQRDASGRAILGFAMHGPQEPLEIGVESPTALPDKGINPITGMDRLQFDAARPVPWVHSILVEWYDSRRDTYWHFEGGIRIHQVANKRVWYPKSSYGDDGSVSANVDKQFAISQQKVLFIQRMILDSAGQPAVASSCSNWQKVGSNLAIPGGPCMFVIEHRGTKNYPLFVDKAGRDAKKLEVRINEAKFNPTRITAYNPFINRQGMVVNTEGFHELTHELKQEDFGSHQLDPRWNEWDMGDSLLNADVPATIQH
jgi:hypothetical protein